MAPSATDELTGQSDYGSSSASLALRPLFKDLIVVLVGPEEERFTAQEHLLRNRSPFLKAACSKEWAKGTEKVIRLPDHDPDAFRTYLKRAHESTGHLQDTLERTVDAQQWKGSGPDNLAHVLQGAIRLWILADYLSDRGLKNEAMDILHKNSCHGLAFKSSDFASVDAALIMDLTPSGCGLQRWLIDYLAIWMLPPLQMRMADTLPADLLRLVMKRMVPFLRPGDGKSLTRVRQEFSQSQCEYHDHPEGDAHCEKSSCDSK